MRRCWRLSCRRARCRWRRSPGASVDRRRLAALLADRDLLIVGDRALAQEQVQQAESRLLQVLAEYHQQHADQLGLGAPACGAWGCLSSRKRWCL